MALQVPAMAQEGGVEKEIEEVSVVGSQIRGASISDALAVSVITAEDIEVLGIDSGDELLDLIPENGQNFLNEAENISGGVNAARGDVGAFNLRNLGTGNTLVLFNGRRLVNSATFQTEEVGGSFVPVNSVNSNVIPVSGMERVEVLRDGASAIYGADAVAGVVNHVMKTDFEGFSVRGKWTEFEHTERNDQTLTVEWGQNFNEGRTNVSAFFNYYTKDRVSAHEDERWADSDFRERVPEDSPWYGATAFRNNSANSLYGQFDSVRSVSGTSLRNNITDSSGEFETYPSGDERCQYEIGYGTCGGIDGQGTYRWNLNDQRDLSSELERTNLFVYINHELKSGVESFTELSYYSSSTSMNRHPSASFSTSKLRVAADNYWNPLGPCGSVNRLPDSVIGDDVSCDGVQLYIDNYRFAELPRVVDNDGDTFRFVQGFRGTWNEWDWESAVVWSEANKDDVTHNRVSNTLMQEALNDTTSAAYNPFSGGVNSNIERALIDVTRISRSDLKTFDVKFSNNELFALPAGNAGFLLGYEYREESFKDDRDERLDGTIVFTDWDGDAYPFVSDVVNSSPTPDNSGSRSVSSLFAEMQIPVFETLDVQLALRYEDFSDVGNTTVGKVAFGWRPIEQLLVRGSWSQAFRAPNLITLNEKMIARNNTRTDWACTYAADFGGDPDQDIVDCINSTQRTAQGSDQLQPEESDNYSMGVVITPIENLTVTLDYWSIEKENTIGLFGEENHTLLDLYYRLEAGTGNCSALAGNPSVTRDDADSDMEAVYLAAGICPAGDIAYIEDQYANLDTRVVEGHDLAVQYDLFTDVGTFAFKYNGSFLDTFDQEGSGNSALLEGAKSSGAIPVNYPIAGIGDLIGKDGNQDERHSMKVTWRHNDFGASLSAYKIGSFYQDSLTLSDGTQYVIPSMTTYSATFDYRFEMAGADNRLRFGIKNLTDERAPLADRYFGYFADAHRDLGRYFYMDLKASF
jgi:outer membrane receptor protein involved in Fe transport